MISGQNISSLRTELFWNFFVMILSSLLKNRFRPFILRVHSTFYVPNHDLEYLKRFYMTFLVKYYHYSSVNFYDGVLGVSTIDWIFLYYTFSMWKEKSKLDKLCFIAFSKVVLRRLLLFTNIFEVLLLSTLSTHNRIS